MRGCRAAASIATDGTDGACFSTAKKFCKHVEENTADFSKALSLHCSADDLDRHHDGNTALLRALEETARQGSSSETPWLLILAVGLLPLYRWTHYTGVLFAVTSDQRSTHPFLRAFLQCTSSPVAAMFSLLFRRSFSTELALTATANALLRPGDIGRGRFIKLRLSGCQGAANFERTR